MASATMFLLHLSTLPPCSRTGHANSILPSDTNAVESEDVQWPTRLVNNTWLLGSIPDTVHISSLDEQCGAIPILSLQSISRQGYPMLCLNITLHMDGVCILILPASDTFVFLSCAPLLFISTTAFSHFTYYTQPAGSAFSLCHD